MADNTIYFTSTGLPKYVKTNFRHAVWEQEETDQDTINVMFHWNNDKKKDLLALIQSQNPVERLCDDLTDLLVKKNLRHVSEEEKRRRKEDQAAKEKDDLPVNIACRDANTGKR